MKNKKLFSLLLAILMLVPYAAMAAPEAQSTSVTLQPATELSEEVKQKVVDETTEYRKAKDEVWDAYALANQDKEVRVIVELSGDPLVVRATKNGVQLNQVEPQVLDDQIVDLEAMQSAAKEAIKKTGISIEYLNSYTAALNGFAAKVSYDDLQTLAKVPGVVNVYISNEYERPAMTSSNDMVRAPEAWEANGVTGEGMVVAVVDTGVDPTHKDFVLPEGADYVALTEADIADLKAADGLPGDYYTTKVPYAWNYYDQNNIIEDTGASQHGMHVAGTMAANGDLENGGIKGVAPLAQIVSMKVFSNDIRYATTFTDIYVDAIEDAILLGADAINMSLGAPAGFYEPNGLEEIVLGRANDNGVVTAISAGNERNIHNGVTQPVLPVLVENPDTGVLGSPSSNRAAFSVASADNVSMQMNYVTGVPAVEGHEQIPVQPSSGSPDPNGLLPNAAGYDFVYVGIGDAAGFAAVGEAVKGKVAVAIRGNTFTDTLANAQTAGAIALVVYNSNRPDQSYVNMAGGDAAKIPFVFMNYVDGAALKAAKEANPELKLAFPAGTTAIANPTGGQISSFSSMGTTPDLQLKPEITAPGGSIYSTQNGDKYTTMSGTSMAAPHVSGGVALVKDYVEKNADLFGAKNPAELTDFVEILLMNNADIIMDPAVPEAETPYAVRQQGAGMMNLAKATSAQWSAVNVTEGTTSVGEAKVELGEVADSTTVAIEVTNYGDSPLVLVPTTTVLAEKYSYNQFGQLRLEEHERVVDVATLAEQTVPANGKLTISVPLDFSGIDEGQFAEGFVELQTPETSNTAATIVVPFLGFKGEWDEPLVIDVMDNWLLQQFGMADENFWDRTADQNSQFMSSGFLNLTPAGSGYFTDVNKILIAPENKEFETSLGVTSIIPLVSQLRNALSMKYQIVDAEGEDVLRTIGEEQYVRKIYRATDTSLFRFVNAGQWNGQLNGASAEDGQYTYRIESLIDYAGAEPQVEDYNLIVDNTKPVIATTETGEVDYAYDEETKILTIDAKDVIPEGLTLDQISGLQGALAVNVATNASKVYDLEDALVTDQTTGAYQLNLDISELLADNLNVVAVQVFDNVYNFSDEMVVVDPTQTFVPETGTPNIYLTAPDLLNVYGATADREPESYNGVYDVQVDGYVYGWKQIGAVLFEGVEVPAEYVADARLLADDGTVLYQGPAYHFVGTVEMSEGYHEAMVEVLPPSIEGADSARPFSINRRFWIDLTKPTITATPAVTTTTEDTVDVELAFSDNLFDVSLYRNGDEYLTRLDISGTDGYASSVEGTYADTVTLQDGINKITYTAKDMLYETEVTIYVVKGDVTVDALVAAIAEAKTKDPADYSAETAEALATALAEAEAVLANPAATQEEIDAATEKLNAAIAALTVDKAALQAAVDEAKAIDPVLYTDETVAALNEAVAEAEAVLANEAATQEEIEAAKAKLDAAYEALVPKTKEELAPVITAEDVTIQVGAEIDEATLFSAVDPQGNELEVTITGQVNNTAVGSYVIKGTATANGYTETKSITVFVVENDKQALEEAITAAEAVDTTGKTEASQAALEEAIAAAKAVAGDINATQAQIDAAIAALDAAIAGLEDQTVPVPDPDPEPDPEPQLSGLVEEDGDWYYYDPATHVAYANRWKTVDGDTYYFGADTKAVSGLVEDPANGAHYYFDPVSKIQYKNRWKTVDAKTYYFNANGVAVTGKQEIAGVLHFFGSDGVQFKDRWKTLDGKTYYFNSNGTVTKGLVRINGVLHFFGSDGAQFKNRWKTVDDKTYFFNANGTVTTGLIRIDGVLHFFGGDGVQFKSRWITVSGNTYYFNKYGVSVSGLYKSNTQPHIYFFNTAGVQLKNGTQAVNGVSYTFNANGVALGDTTGIPPLN